MNGHGCWRKCGTGTHYYYNTLLHFLRLRGSLHTSVSKRNRKTASRLVGIVFPLGCLVVHHVWSGGERLRSYWQLKVRKSKAAWAFRCTIHDFTNLVGCSTKNGQFHRLINHIDRASNRTLFDRRSQMFPTAWCILAVKPNRTLKLGSWPHSAESQFSLKGFMITQTMTKIGRSLEYKFIFFWCLTVQKNPLLQQKKKNDLWQSRADHNHTSIYTHFASICDIILCSICSTAMDFCCCCLAL